MDTELQQLSDDLGEFLFRWLQACSVYPVVRLPITLHLGAALAAADGRPPPREEEIMRLASLPWFRQGWIPDDLRKDLLRTQRRADRKTVNQALADIAFAAIDAKEVGPYGAVSVVSIGRAPGGWLGRWRAWSRGLPHFLGDRDPLLDSYAGSSRWQRLLRWSGYGLVALVLAVLGAIGGYRGANQYAALETGRLAAAQDIASISMSDNGLWVVFVFKDGRVVLRATTDPANRPVTFTLPAAAGGGSILAAGVSNNGRSVLVATETYLCELMALACVRSDMFYTGTFGNRFVWAALHRGSNGQLVLFKQSVLASVMNEDAKILETDGLKMRELRGGPPISAVPTKLLPTRLRYGSASAEAISLFGFIPFQAVYGVGDLKPGIFVKTTANAGAAVDTGIPSPLNFVHVATREGIGHPLVILGAENGEIAIDGPDPIVLKGYGGAIRDADWSPDGLLLATASDDATVRVWRIADGASLLLQGQRTSVRAVRFTSDGKTVVSVGADGLILAWPVKGLGPLPPGNCDKRLVRGKVKVFNAAGGFGYITPDDGGADVYVHLTALTGSNLPLLKEGQAVQYSVCGLKGREQVDQLAPVAPPPDVTPTPHPDKPPRVLKLDEILLRLKKTAGPGNSFSPSGLLTDTDGSKYYMVIWQKPDKSLTRLRVDAKTGVIASNDITPAESALLALANIVLDRMFNPTPGGDVTPTDSSGVPPGTQTMPELSAVILFVPGTAALSVTARAALTNSLAKRKFVACKINVAVDPKETDSPERLCHERGTAIQTFLEAESSLGTVTIPCNGESDAGIQAQRPLGTTAAQPGIVVGAHITCSLPVPAPR